MNEEMNTLANKAGVQLFDYQVDALNIAVAQGTEKQRLCLYHKTGAGKSVTSLLCMALWGVTETLVITPPATFSQWERFGQQVGVDVECISHAKFRQGDYRVMRNRAIIADEFHLFGGHGGKGWKKLDGLARGLLGPLILSSATPNYNDAERCYCIQHILDPHSCKGGFLEFVYAHCTTRQNPFGQMPEVLGFQRFKDAAAYLASLPQVAYLEDDLVYTISDILVPGRWPNAAELYGYSARRDRIIASQMEERHARVDLGLIEDDGTLRLDIYEILSDLVGMANKPTLVFANHSTVADALAASLRENRVPHGLVTGSTTPKMKAYVLDAFRHGQMEVLVGTATLATGTDGLDKVCDSLVILDDTDDDALRRQLIGRIMPRGADADASKKQVHRLVLQ